MEQQDKSLVKLARQSGFAELHTLVEELALRRAKKGLNLPEYGPQVQLKTLIYLIHQHGNIGDFEGEADLQLLSDLKQASSYLQELRPLGYLNSELLNLDVSWIELLKKYKTKLAKKEASRMLQGGLPKLHSYLELQRLLYSAYAWNEMKFLRGMTESRYLVDWSDLRKLASSPSCLQDLGQIDYCLTGPIPLLHLQGGKWLLSPELLYDHLLKVYIELYLNYRSDRQFTGRVAEGK